MTKFDDRIARLLALDSRLLDAAELAVEEAIKMISDARTPSSAKAAVISTVFRSNGLLEAKKDDGGTKEPHEMSVDELQQQIARLRREAADRSILVIEGQRNIATIDVVPTAAGEGVFD
jgi:hypothetical protein